MGGCEPSPCVSLSVSVSCYAYIRPNVSLSWVDANLACVLLGGYLASLNTAQEWNDVIELLRARSSSRDVFIGLRAAHSALPFM